MLNNELWQAPLAGGGDFYSYQIANSLFFNGTSQALTKTWGSASSDDNKKAISVWIKRTGSTGTRSEIGETTNTKICSASDFNQLEISTNNPSGYSDQFHYSFNGGNNNNNFLAKWRDPSAWMHIIWIYNSDESTTTDRIKVYINGVNYPIADSTYWNNRAGNPYPASGADTSFGKNGQEMQIARYVYNDAEWYGGQMADFIMIDGAASYTDFGELKNGVWIPKDPSGLTFGNNGFHLDFADASAPGNDVSGNNNDFTNVGSIPASAQKLDSPTFNSDSNGGNFCTWNPIDIPNGSDTTFTEGNLAVVTPGSGGFEPAIASFKPSSGKWYWEYRAGQGGGSTYGRPWIAVAQSGQVKDGNYYGGSDASNVIGVQFNTNDGNKRISNSDSSYGSAVSQNQIVQMALDCDNGAIYFGINNTWQASGDPTSGASKTGAALASGIAGVNIDIGHARFNGGTDVYNFGQDGTFAGAITAGGNSDENGFGNFSYAPPTGFLALCSGNLPTAAEVDPAQTDDDYPQKLFSPILYNGSGTGDGNPATNTITGLGFQPDFVNIKERTNASTNPLYDSSRGNTKLLSTVSTDANTSQADIPGLASFDTDGFKVTYPNTGDYYNNRQSKTYVAWCQRANGGTTSTNTAGSIDSTVQVDPSGCFSIATWTGTGSNATIGHGLGAKPSYIIAKNTSNVHAWAVYYGDNTDYLVLNTNAATVDDATYWQDTAPTTDVFSIGTEDGVNASSNTYIAYCFANCEGYIKAGSYEGNGNADGTFVYTGFRPAFIMTKSIDSTSNWQMFDNKRLGYNVDNNAASANLTDAPVTTDMIDILSNGFKLRIASDPNVAETYVYLAMAENPFKYATAR